MSNGPTIPQAGYQAAYAAYVEHVHPRTEGVAPCPVCVSADVPTGGCEDGRALYNTYRLARIGRPIAAG